MDDVLRQVAQPGPIGAFGNDYLKLIASETADPARLADGALEPLRDLAQQRVADRVASCVVDVLEAVQVEQHDRAATMRLLRRGEDLLERLRHLQPVGEPGE